MKCQGPQGIRKVGRTPYYATLMEQAKPHHSKNSLGLKL